MLKSFVGQNKNAAETYCIENDFNCSFKYIDQTSEYYDSEIGVDLITAQTPHQGTLLKEVKDIVFYINSVYIQPEPENPEIEDLIPSVPEGNVPEIENPYKDTEINDSEIFE